MPTTNRELFFDAVEYWKDKEHKKWVVLLTTNKRSKNRRECTDIKYVQARTAEKAIEIAKRECISLKGKIFCRARLAEPADLGIRQ